MTRLVLSGWPLQVGTLHIPKEAAHHARVNRVAVGEPVEVLNLVGQVGEGYLATWNPDGSCQVRVERVLAGRGEPPVPLVLALAVLHTQAFDWAVEKATELGATEIRPVLSARVQGRHHQERVRRWQRVAAAAVAQCGRSRCPQVLAPQELKELLATAQGLRVVADPSGQGVESLRVLEPEAVVVLVGPEGGFTSAELDAIGRSGFQPLYLGPRTLRAETAAAAALSLVQAALGWWTK
ncbi:MAG: 16S rRNA (uracil(1498)-N(3))-methyltransferase [Thermoanaerobaculum sp.]|nr:16S rRNA (uracil(1498)-N(3))-methyltransferase [Thermoanaerobaculum sp.]MDW7967244.1 RsmE family RNA methyltransferase [Thermoanaerobaculum sp.]